RRLRRSEHDPDGDEPGPFARAAAAALARDQSALTALEDACSALARAAASLGDEERTRSRGEWAQVLAAALADASLPPGGARGAPPLPSRPLRRRARSVALLAARRCAGPDGAAFAVRGRGGPRAGAHSGGGSAQRRPPLARSRTRRVPVRQRPDRPRRIGSAG